MSPGQVDPPPNRLYLTNDYSIVSKYSAAKLGYYSDPLLLRLVEDELKVKKGSRRAPIVNVGYANRVLVVNHKITNLINTAQIDCVIVLGCGYDTLAARQIGSGCNWIEIDLPEVITNKASFLSLEWGQPMIKVDADPDLISFDEKHPIHLISCDIRCQSELSRKLSKVISRLNNIPRIAILNEVCLNYMETEEVFETISTIINCVKQKAFSLRYIGFEQVRPSQDDPFTRIMTNHFQTLGHPLKHFLTRNELENMFIERLKFSHFNAESLHKIYRLQDRLMDHSFTAHFDREPFDELEELDMYMAHYALVEAEKTFGEHHTSSSISPRPSSERKILAPENYRPTCSDCIRVEPEEYIRRYGHSVCVLVDTPKLQSVLISGGFGMGDEGGSHKRLEHCRILVRDPTGVEPVKMQDVSLEHFDQKYARLTSVHGQTCCLDAHMRLIFFCGGRESPTARNQANSAFIASITADSSLRHVHTFSASQPEGGRNMMPSDRWRHRLVKRSDDKVIQVGGLTGAHTPLEDRGKMPMFIYSIQSNKMSVSREMLHSVEPRHSFGMDLRDDHVLLIYGGLKIGKRFCDKDCKFARSDSDIRPALETLVYDFRVGDLVMREREKGDSAYGMQVHFINQHQFVRVGGISTSTGLAYHSVDLFDLRKLADPLLRAPVASNGNTCNDLLLCNAQSIKFESSQEIVSFGGGGTCFTFGTHLNRSQIVYNYSQAQDIVANNKS